MWKILINEMMKWNKRLLLINRNNEKWRNSDNK